MLQRIECGSAMLRADPRAQEAAGIGPAAGRLRCELRDGAPNISSSLTPPKEPPYHRWGLSRELSVAVSPRPSVAKSRPWWLWRPPAASGEARRIPLPRGAFSSSRSVSPFLPISSRTRLTGESLPEARPAGLEGSMSVSYRLSTRRFGELVLESGHVTLDQLDTALHAKRDPRERLGQTLVRLGYLDEGQVIELLAKQF